MRYSIMLQLVTGITLVLVVSAALFAWIQNRPNSTSAVTGNSNSNRLNTLVLN
jgi:succinate dehydrogenase hydrophobic anchor subunit